MQTTTERNSFTSLNQLSIQTYDGLKSLWSNSCTTKTEWIGTIVSAINQPDLSIIPLGQQSENMVSSPVVDLYRRSLVNKGSFNEEFIKEEIKRASQDLKQTLDDSGFCYQGRTLFLLPQQYICDAISQIATREGDLLIVEEEFLGLAHTHPFRNKLSHLPSLQDLRLFVFGLINQSIECVTSNGLISMLVKTANTPVYFNSPERNHYLNIQRINDAVAFDGYCESFSEDQANYSVLKDNCNKFGLQLLEGNVQDNSQLSLIF